MSTNPLKEAVLQLKTITVLYVEDELSAREEIAYFLESKVQKLYQAKDGAEGLALFEKHQDEIDIVITDIQMPNMNGLEMAGNIKELSIDMPIIVTSAFNDSEYLFKAIEIGISHYVTKPVDLIQLIQKIAQIAQNLNLQKAFAKTKKSLEYYQKAIDERMLLTKCDDKGRIIYVNDKLSIMTGFEVDELIGSFESKLWSESEVDEGKYDTLFEKLKNEHYYHDVIMYTTKQGASLVVDLTAFTILDDANQIEGYIFIRNDITELINYRKLLENRLNVNKQDLREKIHFLSEYQKALDLGTALCRMDVTGKITYANQTFINLLGFEGQDIIGNNYFKVCEFGDGSNSAQILKQNIYEKKVYNASVLHRSIKGKQVHLSSAYIPIFDIHHEIIEIVCIHHDLTEIMELNREIHDTQRELIYTLGEVTENRSNETGNHVKRVAEYAAILAKYSGYEKDVEVIKIASTMHDIGKIAIEDSILKKPGKLTTEEFIRMKEHSIIGYHMFKNSKRPILQAAAIIAKDHHEKWDGSGYPDGLKAEDIHPYGRMVAIADVFDALGSDRVYKKAWDLEKIYALFKEERGKHFDPDMIDVFFAHLDEILEIKKQYID
jgi:PAS domain S-box-containing protein